MRLSGVTLLLLGLPGLAFSQVCSEIEDDTQRLACYDAQETVPEQSNARTSDADAPPVVAAESLQEFGQKEPLDAPREYIEATVIEVAKSGNIEYLRLDNGQVWREIGDSQVRFKAGAKVTITEGVLNSFDLKVEGRNKIVKVRRVK